MRESLYRQVDAEYALLREQEFAEQEARQAEAEAADPLIGVLAGRRMERFRQTAQRMFTDAANAQQSAETLRKDIVAINAEIRARLKKAGFDEDYLQPRYRCAKCKDTGFVGEPIRERCECFMARVRQLSVERQGMGIDPSETFSAYNAEIYPDVPLEKRPGHTQRSYMELVKARCMAYADAYPHDPRRNLLFVGAAGLGKTYLLNCVGNALLEKGVPVLKVTSYQLTERMRAAVFQHDWEGFSAVLETPVLLLDDLGAEPIINNVTIEQLFTLLNERELNGLHTVISTNLTPLELKARYTERIGSRLMDRRSTAMLPFYGDDVRLKG